MRTSPPPLHSPKGKQTNISFSVLKELPLAEALAHPPRRQKWVTAPAARLLRTLRRHHRMMQASLLKANARAPPSGNNRDPGHRATLRHTNTLTSMAPSPPIGIGRRPRWTLKPPPRFRCPACMTNPWIPQRLQPPCMRNPHLLRPLCMRNRPPAREICRGPLIHCQRPALCLHQVRVPRLPYGPPSK